MRHKPIEYTGGRMKTKVEKQVRQDWLEKSIAKAEDIRKRGLLEDVKGALPYYILKYGDRALALVKTNNAVINVLLLGTRQLFRWARKRLHIK